MESKSYTERLTGPQREFVELARRHYENDLTTTDRELLEKAGNRVGLYTTIGASVGLGLGLFLSLRVRRAGIQFYNAAKKVERPVAIQFKDGHTVPFPDIDAGELFRPSPMGQFLLGSLFSIAGFFVGGELGLFTGTLSANSLITRDPSVRSRIESAFTAYRIDALRKSADLLEKAHPTGEKVI